MDTTDHASSRFQPGSDPVQPYTMHVSARYLELTRKKLEQTRLPRELPTKAPIWTYGTPKSVLEPLLDYWLDQYDWRAQEASLNNRLPQFRYTLNLQEPNSNNNADTTNTNTEQQRIHFVHKRCQTAKAIPLLYCHGWPGSFLEVSKIIDGLSEPYFATVPAEAEPPIGFHVVVPSIPGFGFSDVPTDAEFGLQQTADCFNKLMVQLGYVRYVAHGSGLGFAICRMLSLKHGANCVAVHAISPQFPAPQLRKSYNAALRYQIAYLTHARYDRLAFGYTPADVLAAGQGQNGTGISSRSYDAYADRPQTRAFSLTDSPAALLGTVLDLLRPHALDIPPKPPTTQPRPPKPASVSSSRSSSMDNVRRTTADPFMEPIRESIESGLSLLQLTQPGAPAWTPNDILNWTMMIWLPGPEGGLRWLNTAVTESVIDAYGPLWTTYSGTPLGISTFRDPNDLQIATGDTSEPRPTQETPTRLDSVTSAPTPFLMSWWQKLWRWPMRSSGRTDPSARLAPESRQLAHSSPPAWAAAYQRLEWVRRHDSYVRLPVWEASDQVVVDIRDCFGNMQERGLIQL